MYKWYVIWVTTGKEEWSRSLIERFAPKELYSRCAIPYMTKFEKKDGVRRKVQKLMIPSYIFVRTDRIDEFAASLHKIPGFTLVLSTDGWYQPLDPHEEYLLTTLIGTGETVDISTGFIEGQKVTITLGPLKGLEGQIKKIDRHHRAAFLEMNMFGKTTQVKVGLEIVEKK